MAYIINTAYIIKNRGKTGFLAILPYKHTCFRLPPPQTWQIGSSLTINVFGFCMWTWILWEHLNTRTWVRVYYGQVPQTGCLKNQKLIVSEFGELEVWDQDVGRIGSFCWLWEYLLLVSPLDFGILLAIFGFLSLMKYQHIPCFHVYVTLSLCAHVCAPIFSFYEVTSYTITEAKPTLRWPYLK